jgi:hypothetical protein
MPQTYNPQPNEGDDPPSSPDSLFSMVSSDDVLPAKSTSQPQRKVKLMELESKIVSSGSSLTTKQRIFQGAAGSLNPNPILKPLARVAPPRPQKTIPSGSLGFKKRFVAPPLPHPEDTGSGSEPSDDEHLCSDADNYFASGAASSTLSCVQQPGVPDLPPVEDRSVVFVLRFTILIGCSYGWFTDFSRINLQNQYHTLFRLP